MHWIPLVLIRALFKSGREVTLKLSLSKHDLPISIVAFWMTCVPAVMLAPFVFYTGQWSAISDSVFMLTILGNVACNVVNYFFQLSLIRKFDISYVAAMEATSPVFFMIFAFVLLGEVINPTATFSIFIIVAGAILLETSRKETSGRKKTFATSGWPYLIIYLCFAALATVCSKIAVTNGPPEAYIMYRYTLLSIIFALVIKNKMPFLKRAPQKIFTKINMKPALAGLLNTGAVIAEMRALQMSEIGRVEALTKVSLIITLFLEFVLIKRQFCKIRFTAVLLILLGSVGAVVTF